MSAFNWRGVLSVEALAGHAWANGLPLSEVLPIAEQADLEREFARLPRKSIRLRPGIDPADLPFQTEPVPWFPRGRFVSDANSSTRSIRPGGSLHYAAGEYYIQDASSLLAVALSDVRPGQWVADVCASPGGKATALAELLGGQGVLLANEVIGSRVELLSLALNRSGYGNHIVCNQTVERLSQVIGPVFDCVLVDAPCSGQSLVVRGKQSTASFSERQIEHSAARQRKILRAAASLVRPGGRLVYSTCTYAVLENEAVVLDFVRECPGWTPLELADFFEYQSLGAAGCYRLWPHRQHCAGAFAAVLQRTEEADRPTWEETGDGATCGEDNAHAIAAARASHPAAVGGRGRRRRRGAHRGSKNQVPQWVRLEGLPEEIDWWKEGQAGTWMQRGSQLYRMPPDLPAQWQSVLHSGVTIAEWQAQQWRPAYGSAVVMPHIGQPECYVELDDEQATAFCMGQSVPVATADRSSSMPAFASNKAGLPPPGSANSSQGGEVRHGSAAANSVDSGSSWCVVHWRGHRLSWAKHVDGKLKNHFPKAFRQTSIQRPGNG